MSEIPKGSPFDGDVLLIILPSDENKHQWVEKMEKRYLGLKVHWFDLLKPDGTFRTAEDIPKDIWDKKVTFLAAGYAPPPASLIPKIRWVQLPSAGADRWLSHPKYQEENVLFTTANGIHAPQIAEWVIGSWLSFQHHFPMYQERMSLGQWDVPLGNPVQDSPGLRMGIIGYGAIGRQCARLGVAMAMEVFAFTRHERSTPDSKKDDSYYLPGTGDPDGVLPKQWFHGTSRESINDFLGQDLDLLILSLPGTAESRHLLSTEQFAALSKKKTFVANVARGTHIDQEALIRALETGQIRGAALDVTDPEPLPPDHPLWSAPNLLITPHSSWKSGRNVIRLLEILEINLDRLATGKPLINLVNRKLHY
ncbi:D-isomer specific 2-hydroxyacid dehydrogenase [Xylariomycetidae sp. FL2044]|nr:D-isomer specific 2-hydroxyacid dehydrogenase [Xylariomycetidae sp. FL2044]